MTTCNTCKNSLPNSCFDKNKKKKNGLFFRCKNCRKSYSKARYEANKELIKSKALVYYKNNKEKTYKARQAYQKRKMQDPKYVLTRRLRNRLYYALKDRPWKKNTHFSSYIGCTRDELVSHIQSQFEPGMSWDNRSDWHVDHIIPLNSAATEDDLYKLCHYTNLKPMWALDNIKKGTKVS